MTFGLSAAAIGAIAVGAGSIGSAVIGSSAADKAANAQMQASANGVAEQQRQFDAMKELLSPYVKAGDSSLTAQQNLMGLNGNQAQTDAINGIKSSSQYDALNKSGQDAILQNASATGGLRGGNTEAALAQFSPQLLNSLIQQQYTNLGGLTSLGQSSAAMTGNAGMQSANQISNLYQQSGAAQAGDYLAQGKAVQSGINSIYQGLGVYQGLGGKF